MSARVCSIEGCPKPHVARGWCNKHYLSWHRHGDPLWVREERVCSIEGCGEEHHARGWCETHYRCWQRTGDPIPQHVYEKDKPCKIDGCPNKRYGRGWCNRHYKAWWHYGDPLAVDSRPVTYLAAHKRVYRARGQAAALSCVDCGQPAAEWSYRHGCADERVGEPRPGLMAAFCVHPEHYDPRCKSCHGIYDAA